MNIVTCYKIARDERDLVVNADRSVTFDKCALRIGDYDLNAIEAGVQLAAATGGDVCCLTVGGDEVKDSKLRKGVLSRGAARAIAVADARLAEADAADTSRTLAAALTALAEYDLVLCGEGSADRYAQQVGALLAARLGLPYVNGVSAITPADGKVVVERTLEDEIDTLEFSLPAVVSVVSDMNSPRIPSMKDILSAAKKPTTDWTLADIGVSLAEPGIEVVSERAPDDRQRAGKVYEATHSEEFFTLLRQLIEKETT
jgi:electron transfer flavoprotein beta subunit